jgi:spore coat polysaccharide biosynthesis predicted glycosyltransferase SpsG
VSGAGSALLHHKFRHFNIVRRKYRKKIRNIFVDLGDLLPYRDLRAVVDALHRLGYKMKIAPGLTLKKADKRNLMKIYPGSHFCGKSESLARAYFEADLALIPAGEEALDAAAVGTPALFMPLLKEQELLADAFAGQGTGVRIPSLADFSVPTVRDAITPLTLERREQMGAAGKKLVDGLGVHRFFKILKDEGIIA